ncbi:MAG: double-cubane-cluster-containing anaerobic reductase [Spirochaetota bacterium]|nr:double-cubane-cluster-containing anaerobic reductase [Spirochaetota bacterium]
MSEDYRKMWSDLEIDLEVHDALLDAVSSGYNEVYLSQENRPEGMGYFNFVVSEVHGLRIKELVDAKREGRRIIGSFCTFVPEELILAVDGISIGLCAGAEFAFEEAEKYLPSNTCALIKSAFGFRLGKVCPYLEASDLVVGENTCDGKKKSYEHMDTLIDNLYIMDLPQMKSEEGKSLLKKEYIKFAQKLEDISGKKIGVSKLKESIQLVNNKRKAVHRISGLRNADPAPISGLDALLINQIFFFDDPIRFTKSVNQIADELGERVIRKIGAKTQGATRILLSGCPMALPNWKVPHIIETNGAVIVGEESCVGERGTHWLTKESGDSIEDLIDNIVDRYFEINCAVFTQNSSRLERIRELYKRYNADGIIHYNLQFCQPYQIESNLFEGQLEKEGIPFLRIDTDYSQEDSGQLTTRVEAFIERLKG